MRKIYLLVLSLYLAIGSSAQAFYNEPFNSASFPAGWAPDDARVILANSVPSSGYSSSATSPQASGGYNVLCQHCAPSGSSITLTVSGVINTIGKTNIRVGFGRRISPAWDRPVAFDWSSDGANWNAIDSDVSFGATSAWDAIYYDLPSGAENVANLRFRFIYMTTNNMNCTAPPNFRIDDFTVGSNFTLPVELIDFQASATQHHARLQWATASETNSDYFAVERSADGANFIEIGRINGAGTTRQAQQYTFWDKQPQRGHNYYRLRQVDFDQRAVFSPIRSVAFFYTAPIRFFPSPATEQLTLAWMEPPEADADWEIYDTAGRSLARGRCQAGQPDAQIPVQTLPAGTFLIRLTTAQEVWTQTFLKR